MGIFWPDRPNQIENWKFGIARGNFPDLKVTDTARVTKKWSDLSLVKYCWPLAMASANPIYPLHQHRSFQVITFPSLNDILTVMFNSHYSPKKVILNRLPLVFLIPSYFRSFQISLRILFLISAYCYSLVPTILPSSLLLLFLQALFCVKCVAFVH